MAEATSTESAKSEDPNAGQGEKPTETAPEKKVPDEAYVKALRKEAADNRKALEAATTRLREIEDRDKSESEKLTQRAAESDRRAVEAEAKLLRVEIAAERKMPARAVALLHGTTREEIEASADELAALLKETEKATPGFDGGARREQPPESKKPELAHNDWLLQALGRSSPS